MEEEKITEAETESATEEKEAIVPEKRKKRKTDLYVEMALIVVLGFLVGVAIKTEATKRVTIGFDDYKMKIYKNDYNLNELEIIQANKQAQAAADQSNQSDGSGGGSADSQATSAGGSCSANQ